MFNQNSSSVSTVALSNDYLTLTAPNQKAALEMIDYYSALGWELASQNEGRFISNFSLVFKRNRRIKSKDQLNRLQYRLDDNINKLDVLEKRKYRKATIVSLIIGIIGILIFGSGMSLCIAWSDPEVWMYIVGGILAAIGIIPCVLSYFFYTNIRLKETTKMNILINQSYEDINRICEEAQQLI